MAGTMRSIRSSDLAVLLAAIVGLSLAVPVAAVSTSASNVPEAGQVDTEVGASYTMTDLYEDGIGEWTLRASTGLTGASWTVEKRKLSGEVITESHTGNTFETSVSSADGVETVTVSVTGNVPALREPHFEPEETFSITRLVRITDDGESQLGQWSVHHYTAESREAREAIQAAQAVVDDDAPEEAKRSLEQAISAYNAGNFENAVSNAEDAQRAVEKARKSRSRMQAALYAGLGVLALLVVFGGAYYYQRRQESYSELR